MSFFLSLLNISIFAVLPSILMVALSLFSKKFSKKTLHRLRLLTFSFYLLPYRKIFSIFKRNKKGISSIPNLKIRAVSFQKIDISPSKSLETSFYLRLVILVLLLGALALSTLRFKKKLGEARKIEGNVYRQDFSRAAFTFGLINPKIYLPQGLRTFEEEAVLAHERAHLKRGDNRIRLLVLLISFLHFFNPLVRLCLYLFSKDLEASCDEESLKTLGRDKRASYCQALLNLGGGGSGRGIAVLAFGGSDIRGRILNLREKKEDSRLRLALLLSLGLVLTSLSDSLLPSLSLATPNLQEKSFNFILSKTEPKIRGEREGAYYLAKLEDGDLPLDCQVLEGRITREGEKLKILITLDGEKPVCLLEDENGRVEILENKAGLSEEEILTLLGSFHLEDFARKEVFK